MYKARHDMEDRNLDGTIILIWILKIHDDDDVDWV
jgi:hypothetical protein